MTLKVLWNDQNYVRISVLVCHISEHHISELTRTVRAVSKSN